MNTWLENAHGPKYRWLDRDLTEDYRAKLDPDLYLSVATFDPWGRTLESRRRNAQIAKLIDATHFQAAPEPFPALCPWVPKPGRCHPLVWAQRDKRLVTVEPTDTGGRLIADLLTLATNQGWSFLRIPSFGIRCTPNSHFCLLSPPERGIDVHETRRALEGIALGQFKSRNAWGGCN